jgi:hypothetical protein
MDSVRISDADRKPGDNKSNGLEEPVSLKERGGSCVVVRQDVARRPKILGRDRHPSRPSGVKQAGAEDDYVVAREQTGGESQ